MQANTEKRQPEPVYENQPDYADLPINLKQPSCMSRKDSAFLYFFSFYRFTLKQLGLANY